MVVVVYVAHVYVTFFSYRMTFKLSSGGVDSTPTFFTILCAYVTLTL